MKNALLLIVISFCFTLLEINAKAQEGRSLFKDSAQYNAFRAQVKLTQSMMENARLGIKDSSQINALKALAAKNQESFKTALPGMMGNLKSAQVGMYNSLISSAQDGDKELSSLSLSKLFKGESLESTKKFTVSENYTMLTLNLIGQVKSGVISINLIKPNGSKFKTIEIDATSDVNFSQTLDLKKDPKGWVGDWQIKIKADKADGNYRLNILTR